MEKAKIFSLSAAQSPWRVPPENPETGGDEAHIWLARLDERKAADLAQILSDDERARAGRFRFERDRKHFIVARGFLRIILGKYLKTSPENLRFEYNKYGKLFIADTRSELKFNLSHSDDLALYAVTRRREIGIDLERIKKDFVEDGMIANCLTSREAEHFKTLSENRRVSFFFDCWTLKEAYLKASGEGFLIPPNQIETSSFIDFPKNLGEEISKIQNPPFSLQKLPPIPGCKAALAIEGKEPRLRFWLLNFMTNKTVAF